MINFGTALAGLGGAAPQILQMQEQQRQRQAMQNIVRMYMQKQQQPQSPGGIQPAGQMPQPAAPQDYLTQIVNSGRGGVPSPGASPTQAQPVPALPGSQPQPMGGDGDSNAMMNAYIQQMMSDPTGMQAFAQRMQSAGIPESEWGDTLSAGAPMMKGAMNPEERLMATMMTLQQRQYGSDPSRYKAGLPDSAGNVPPPKEVVSKNDVVKAYQDWQKNPDDKSLEKNWSDKREAFNSAKMPAGGGKTDLSDKSLDEFADKMEAMGDIPSGLGYGKNPDKVAVVNRHSEKYPNSKLADSNLNWIGEKSEKRAEGTRAGAIEIRAGAVEGAAKMAIESSNKVNRTNYPTLNSILLAGEKQTGGTDVIDLAAKTNTLINEYAAAQNPNGVPRIEDKKYAREILEQAYSKGQYETGVKAIVSETRNIKKKTGQVMRGEDTSETLPGDSENAPDYSHLWSQ